MPRLRPRDLLPSSVDSRNLSNFIFGSDEGKVTTTLANGERAVITSILTQEEKYEIFGEAYMTAYVGSIADTNLLPGGSSVDETDWVIIPPYRPYYKWEDSLFARHIEYAQMVIVNNTGSSQNIIVEIKWRYMSPREGAS